MWMVVAVLLAGLLVATLCIGVGFLHWGAPLMGAARRAGRWLGRQLDRLDAIIITICGGGR